MALNTTVNNFSDGSILLKDATAVTPLSTGAIQYQNGDLAISGLKSTLREHAAYEARGVLTGVRYTTRVYPTISFTCQMTGLTNATAGLAADAIRKTGFFASGVSTLGASADVWAVTLVWTVEGSNFGGADSTLTATDCVGTIDVSEGDPNSVSISLTCYGTVTLA